MSLRSFLLILFALLAFSSPVIAQDDDDDDSTPGEPKLNTENPDIDFTSSFANNPFNMVSYGERMQLDVLVKNKGSKNWTIVSGSGALVNPDNFAQVIRNLSVYRYDANLKPKGSLKIPFHFTASVEPPVDVGLLVLFDYYESGKEEKPYRGVAHSAVVKVVYTDSAFDLQSIFLYIMGLATLAGAGYLIKNTYFVQSVKKTKRASISVVKTNSADPQSADTFNQEWIPDHVLRQQKSGKSPSIRKRKA